MAKKGYAYTKAIQLIAYERGLKSGELTEADKPKLPKSSAKRGAIISWKNKIARGYRPRSKETKEAFDKEAEKTNIAIKRPYLRVERIFHSKRPGADIRDVIFGFYIAEGEAKERYLELLNFTEDDLEEMYLIAEKLGENNNPNDWNQEFKKAGIDAQVFTENWIK